MRKLLLLFAFVLIAASRAQAQASTEFHSVVAPGPLASMSTGAAGGQSVVFGPHPTRRCCSRKGALIGAAIGAGAGLALSLLCDSSNCTSDTIKAVVILGGIGAGIGMMTRHPSRQGPFVPTYGAIVSVRF